MSLDKTEFGKVLANGRGGDYMPGAMSGFTIHARPVLVRAVVSVMLVHFLAVLTMAFAPDLHELAHHDEHEESHQCVVTDMLSSGAGDGVPPQSFRVAAILPLQFVSVVEFDPGWIASLFLTGGVLEHAPPARA